MSQGLAVSDVVNVSVVMSPIAAAVRNFGSLLLVGSTPGVIDVSQRLRSYTSLTSVAADFGTTAPEYLAASLYFGQVPTPSNLYVGFWAAAATSGLLHGGLLSTAQQAMSAWNAITAGAFKITIDGVLKSPTTLNFSAAINMNGVASIVQTGLAGSATCVWNAIYNRLDITSATTGPGVNASGTITLTANPTAADTVTIAGTAITFVASGAVGNQVNIGASVAATSANLQAFLSASADVNLITCTYSTVTATGVTTVKAATAGVAGNAITLAKVSTNITVSGAVLSGGVNPSSVSYAVAPSSGTDISGLLGLTAATGALVPVNGVAAETLLSGINTLATVSNDWYGLNVCSASAAVSDHLAVSGYIEAATPSRIYGITSQDSTILTSTVTTDIASQLQALGYKRTFTQYSSSSPYAAISIFGRAFTVDFTQNNSTITIKFKTEPGIVAETLTESQAAALTAKSCNVFVNYNNSTAIVQQGTMANGYFFDEVHGTDWLQNNAQTAVYNLLYLSPTKIPQTDPGINQIVNVLDSAMAQGVTNGLLAPGTWSSSLQFGALHTGDTLSKGYYIYAPPVASQNISDRQARKAPAIQIAVKLAGAVHFANVAINVNR